MISVLPSLKIYTLPEEKVPTTQRKTLFYLILNPEESFGNIFPLIFTLGCLSALPKKTVLTGSVA